MDQVTVQVKAALNVVAALADAIRELKEVPSGVLYSSVMGQLSLESYGKVIDVLKKTGLVTEENHLLRWVNPA